MPERDAERALGIKGSELATEVRVVFDDELAAVRLAVLEAEVERLDEGDHDGDRRHRKGKPDAGRVVRCLLLREGEARCDAAEAACSYDQGGAIRALRGLANRDLRVAGDERDGAEQEARQCVAPPCCPWCLALTCCSRRRRA